MEKKEVKVCSHCVMNSTDSDIRFDKDGSCNWCRNYEEVILPYWNYGKGHEKDLENLIADIKKSGEGKDYDCLIGLSGGLDSSYMLHLAVKEWGLRPFVFHIDAGWDLPVTTENLSKMVEKMGIKMHVEKPDWDELRRMQIAFFKAGSASLDAPQDHAFIALVDHFAMKLGVKYILNGYNIPTEVIGDPASWFVGGGSSGDSRYIKDVLKKNGNVKVKKYIWTSGFRHKFWLPYVKGVKTVTPLNFIPLTRQQMIDTLHEEYGFEFYGQKHFEDEITKFIEGYWLPKRFGYDIRMSWLSSLVVTGQMTREEALRELEQPPMTEEEGRKMFKEVARKLEISEEELQGYLDMPFVPRKYKNSEWAFKIGIWLYTKLGLDHRIRQ